MNPKVTHEHLSRKAVVYIRQSTYEQVKHNLESQRRQYELAGTAEEMGFSCVEIIDEDLGRSGATSHKRTGFLKLVAAVSMKEVGAIFCLEASRLARNNRDWAHLIDLCSLVETIIVDYDGVYDPRILNDRLLLGLKGTMSEFELGLIRQRALAALKDMAHRGELLTTLPVGFIKTKDRRCEKDPDLRVQQAINLVFTKFAELGSARQVLIWFRQEKISLPAIKHTGQECRIEWKPPVYNTILHILQNPTYAGVYAYGRTKTMVKTIDGQALKVRGYPVPREEWEVFIPNHHEGYISLGTYEKNQQTMGENACMKGRFTKGPVRSGRSLLAGLLRCQRCGRKLHVTYSGKDGRVPRYSCRGANVNHGKVKCISFGGLGIDKGIEKEVLSVIDQESISLAITRQENLLESKNEHRRAVELALKQAEYEAERSFRQYDAVEPENRLVASELEQRLNQKLLEIEHLKEELEKIPKHSTISQEEKRLLNALSGDFSLVWHDERTDVRLKKRLVRILIEEIYVDVDEKDAVVDLVIRWAGGVHTSLRFKKNHTGRHRFCTDKDAVELVRELAKISPDSHIARILNMLKLKTGRGLSWTEGRVRSLRNYRKIPAYSPERKEQEGWLNMEEAARYLGISPMSVRRLLESGKIKGKQIVAYAPWIIKREDLDEETVRNLALAIKEGKRIPQKKDLCQASFNFVDIKLGGDA